MPVRREWVDYFVIFLIIIVVVAIFYNVYRSEQKGEIRTLEIEGIQVNIPPGFKMLSKLEKKNLGYSERISILTKGNMSHLLMLDVEKGLPEIISRKDLDEYLSISVDELKKNVEGFSLSARKVDVDEGVIEIRYKGKIKDSEFSAIFYSRIFPGKKINITISTPSTEEKYLDQYYNEVTRNLRITKN